MQSSSDRSSNETSAMSVDVKQLLQIVVRNIFVLAGVPVLCALIGFLIVDELAPKYKSVATIAIQASYFQNPLLGDLVVQASDPAELQSQRLGLIKKALKPEFLEFVGDTYQQFKFPRSIRQGATEREDFISRIGYFPAGTGTFRLSAVAEDPQIAKLMNEDIIAQIGGTLVTERYQLLLNIQAAVRAQLIELSKTLQVPVPSLGQELTQNELIEREISNLLKRFTEAHPRIQELRRQLREISKPGSMASTSLEVIPVPSLSKLPFNRRPLEEVYAELAKKLNYLNVAISMERDWSSVDYFNIVEAPNLPLHKFFPQKKVFVGAGGGLGCLLSVIWLVFLASKARRATAVRELSDALGLVVLGRLPPMSEQDQAVLRRAS